MDEEVHGRRHEVEDNTGIEHFLSAVKFDRTTGKDAGEERAEDKDAGGKPRFAHGSAKAVNRLRCDDDHQHVIDDVDEEVD